MKRLAVEIVVVAAAISAWWYTRPEQPNLGTTVAQQAPELKGERKEEKKPPQVPVYGHGTKKKLGLPEDIQDDPNKYVLGSAKLPSDTRPHTITTVIDAETGEVQTHDRRDPLPWLSAKNTGEARIDIGIKNGFETVTRLSVREDFLQIKAINFGVVATIDSDGAIFVGAGISYRW